MELLQAIWQDRAAESIGDAPPARSGSEDGRGGAATHLLPQVCASGAPCADPRTNSRQRLIFQLVAISLLALLAVPWFAPLFY